jgi:2-polyprenyl-3-methyl-5-hydroxy-6-metoxy-1,4-benzoquinol methylase
MNYKLLVPTYRTRHRFVDVALTRAAARRPLGRVLNLGSGEGDYDRAIKRVCRELHSCDVNASDVAFARAANAGVDGIHYAVEDGEALSYEDGFFDAVVCVEVVEHVSDARRLLSEIARVLAPDGTAIVTCPNESFPVSYDPVNRALRDFGVHLPIGAYAYGHTRLVEEGAMRAWLEQVGLAVTETRRLSKRLVGMLECYWPSVLQSVLKANAENRRGSVESTGKRGFAMRPSSGEPPLLGLIDRLIDLDASLFEADVRSVGLGFIAVRSG